MPTRPPLPKIDAAPLKDMARNLRFVAERGGRLLKDALPLDALPDPAVRVADAALTKVRQAEREVAALAHRLLDEDGTPPPLDRLEGAAETHFAVAAHAGLRAALARLGAESTLISETAAQRAFLQATAQGAGSSDSATAAALFFALLDAHVVREAIWPDTATLSPAEAGRVATFAMLLAMLADPGGYRDVLPQAVDMALALKADLMACEDPARIAALLDEFRDHV